MDRIKLFNMQGTYNYQDFYKDSEYYSICDLTGLSGTNCYCDDQAALEIGKLINDDGDMPLYFSDSGNYHYMSYFYLSKIKRPMVLIVFDHHPDMQESAFFSILSCGSWVNDVLNTYDFIEKVVLIGVKDELVANASRENISKTEFITESEYKDKMDYICSMAFSNPIYISVDRDVLTEEYCKTNWDQGSMSLEDLEAMIKALTANNTLCGADICGEMELKNGICENDKDMELNNECNKRLMNLFIKK